MKTRMIENKGNIIIDYGIVGDVTDMTYENGEVCQVGDVVEVFSGNKSYGKAFVVKDAEKYFVTGIKSACFINGRTHSWTIKLIKKFYSVNVGEKYDNATLIEKGNQIHKITIDGDEIELSHESYLQLKSHFTK